MHKCTSYGPNKLNLWPFWPLFDPYDLDLQAIWKHVSDGFLRPPGQQLCKIILKSMHKCTSYGRDKLNIWHFWHLFDHCDLDLQPTWKNVSDGTSPHKGNNCAKLSWNTCIIVQVLVRTKPDGRTDACTYTELNCNNYVSLTRKGAQQKCFKSHLLEDNNCANLFWNEIMNVQVMVTTNPMDAHTH